MLSLDSYSVLPHVLAGEKVGDSGFWKDVGCSTSWEKKVPGREVIAILFLFQGSKQLMEQWGGCDSSHIA